MSAVRDGGVYRQGYVQHRAAPAGAITYGVMAELFRIAARARRSAGDYEGARRAFASARLARPVWTRPVPR